MQNGVSAVLAMIQKDLLGLNRHIDAATAGFGRLKLAIAGATGIFLGVKMIEGIADLVKHGEKYTHQLEMMKLAGMGVAEMQSAIAAANKVSTSVMSTTPTENLQTIRELRQALASADVRPGQKADPAAATREAVQHLETFQKITGIMSSLLSKDGKPYDGSGQAYELAKAAEILGLSQDPRKFDSILEGWSQAIVASGGKLQGSDFFGNVKYLRGAGLGMSEEFLTKQLPVLMQELKTGRGAGTGGGAGNPLASMFAEVVGGQMQKKSILAFERLGMMDMTKVHVDRGRYTLDPGAVRGSDVMASNPFKFTTEVLQPALLKFTNYLDKDNKGEFKHQGELRGFLAALFPNRVAQQVAGMMLFQQNRFAGDRALIEAVPSIQSGFGELQRKDPVLVREEMDKQWERLLTDLGKSITPEVTEMIYQFARALNYLSGVVEAHPAATAWFFKIAAGLAVMFIVLGSITLAIAAFGAIFSAGPALLAIAGITALGLAISYLWDTFHASEIRIALQNLGGDFVAFWHALQMWGKGITFKQLSDAFKGSFAIPIDWVSKNIESLQKQILDGLSGLLKSIGAWFADLPSKIKGWMVNPGRSGPPGDDPVNSGVIPTWPTTPGVPPVAANGNVPGSSPMNPNYVHVTNQTSGRDIAHGVSQNQALAIAGPSGGVTYFDQRQAPSFSVFGRP